MSMERSLPKYQFWVMFSVLTTNALLFGYTCTDAAHQTALQAAHSTVVAATQARLSMASIIARDHCFSVLSTPSTSRKDCLQYAAEATQQCSYRLDKLATCVKVQ